MSDVQAVIPFRQAAALLPSRLRRSAEGLDRQSQMRVEELRLRAGRPMTVVLSEGERTVPGAESVIRPAELEQVLEIATQASAHTALERVRSGFFTVRGGHRIGICGTGVVRDGIVCNLRALSSLAIRIARAGQRGGLCRAGWSVERRELSEHPASLPSGGRKDHPAAGFDPRNLRWRGAPRPADWGGGRAGRAGGHVPGRAPV